MLAEAHARPATPLPTPTLAARIAALSGEGGLERDWAHMVSLCRRLQAPEPSPGAKWCLLDAGAWRLRWERHTEISTWTFYRPIAEGVTPRMEQSALDLVPQDWISELPGQVIVAAHIALLRNRPPAFAAVAEEIATEVADGTLQVFTDFRPGADGFTRFQVIQPTADPVVAGRVLLQLFEIETYRLLALLAFPVASEASTELSRLEAEAVDAALHVSEEGGIDADRQLLKRLAALAGRAHSLAARTSFRFSAARAYHGLVQERTQQLRERRLEGRQTIAEFMDRRLAPAMRTCVAVAERQQVIIEHIARSSQLLSTRVEVAAEVTNAMLLESMDKRARLQLRLQQTVEGLSVAAISYYALGLLNYVFKAASEVYESFDAAIATGVAAPLVVGAIWFSLHRLRSRLMADDHH